MHYYQVLLIYKDEVIDSFVVQAESPEMAIFKFKVPAPRVEIAEVTNSKELIAAMSEDVKHKLVAKLLSETP